MSRGTHTSDTTTFRCITATALCLAAVLAGGCAGPRGGRVCDMASLVRTVAPSGEAFALGADIISRDSWSSQAAKENRLTPMGKIYRMTIHHTAGEMTPGEGIGEVKDRLRRIQREHEERMTAGDIGYHFIIDGAGRVWEGRSLAWQGAHAGNGAANEGNIGIAVMGNFDEEDVLPAQMAALSRLVERASAAYGIGRRAYIHAQGNEGHVRP